ncbi:MAG: aminotransferase class III-fold pyridoxal phosphate-dependent enzyme [Bacteriovoracaceae bacterium]|nr:aminotransferase class III-fold pyridoxal phosphate-dependent enzyme [Bacteriovoracaceae bacterium]
MSKSVINSQLICADYKKEYPKILYGKDVFLYDVNGKEYIDTCGCTAAVMSIGHGNEQIANILKEQASKLAVYPTHLFYNDELDNYLKALCEFAPEGFNKAWTISGGTEAVENSVKLAYQYHRSKGQTRTKVIGRWGSYHGNSILALDIGGMKSRRGYYTDLMVDHIHVNACHPYRKEEGMSDEQYEDMLISELQVEIEKNKDDIMCFIAEPFVGSALGAVGPTKNYFEKVHKLCRSHDILVIADEVMTGFGRTGENFGMNHFANNADILALAKGISSGYLPLGAITARDFVLEAIENTNLPFFSGQTYSCIPLAAKVGLGVLNYIKDNNLVQNSKTVGNFLKEKLATLKEEFSFVGDVRGQGLFLGIEFVKNKETKESFNPADKFAKIVEAKCLENGLVTLGAGGSNNYTAGDHLLLAPPLTLTKDHATRIYEGIRKSLGQI